jgi:hypothetical protein
VERGMKKKEKDSLNRRCGRKSGYRAEDVGAKKFTE